MTATPETTTVETRPVLTDAELAEIAARSAGDPFFVSDCEGQLAVWRESALVRVSRDDDTGEIIGYSLPSVYKPTDEVVETIHLDSWDPGEDASDDRRRQDINDLVDSRAALPHLVDELATLRAQVERVRAWATSHEYRWLHELLDGPFTHGGHL